MTPVSVLSAEIGRLVAQITVSDVNAAVEFYRRAFGADELYRGELDGEPRIFFCELLLGGARLLLQDEFPEYHLLSPLSLGGASVTMRLNVSDAETTHRQALDAGAKEIAPVTLKFWGAKTGVLEDPFGHRWMVCSFIEDVDPGEILRRARSVPPEQRLPIRVNSGGA
jgi:PhnB protein